MLYPPIYIVLKKVFTLYCVKSINNYMQIYIYLHTTLDSNWDEKGFVGFFFFFVIKSHLHFVLPSFIDSRSFDDGGCHSSKNELRVAVCIRCIVYKYTIYTYMATCVIYVGHHLVVIGLLEIRCLPRYSCRKN